MRRRTLPTGIYADRYSLRAVVNTAAGRKEKRFDKRTPVRDIIRWRLETIGQFAALSRQRPAKPKRRGSLRSDVERYLGMLTIVSIKSRRSDLAAWVKLYGDEPRASLKPEHVTRAIQAWQAPDARTVKGKPRPFAAWTIRHRLEALRQLFKALDGPEHPTPVDRVVLAKPAAGRAVFVAPAVIEEVAAGLSKHPDTRARHLVMAVTGARPIELQRAQPGDVDLEHGLWPIRTAKGGIARVLRMNTPEMLAAWRAFIAADAWGPYDTTAHARRLRKAGWPDGVRPYALRGTWGMELSRRGVDLADIQQLMGHRDAATTRLYYVPPEDSRLAAATQLLAGRVTVAANTELPTSDGAVGRTVAESGHNQAVQKQDTRTGTSGKNRGKSKETRRKRP